jgi:ABC-2 type transport system permease protein
MNMNVLYAVFKRNLVSYFASPTGYVFICVFVLLSAFAAFWPNEFFNANLANLDQLNMWFPYIMLVFIPAITMAIWAEERREGTDELLLTIPASDFNVVLGKYLAAVSIYTLSLLFSLVSNYLVLSSLGNPDVGLFLGTYFGYWMVGLAMLAVGMVASFLTSNVTVAYVLAAVFNAPLVFAAAADAIPITQLGSAFVRGVKQWSIGGQFHDFGRGVISFSSMAYFLGIVVVLLYLSMVLIGRRHWVSGRNRAQMIGHYLVRTVALLVIALAVNVVFGYHDVRLDVTDEQLSSLSPQTRKLLDNLDVTRPVKIEAFISPDVPEAYVQTRLDLLSMLRELQARGGEKVRVRINDTERFSEEAALAEDRYNIVPRQVTTLERGALSTDHIFMGVAFTCGLEKVIVPFIDRGIPVEYELVRSVCTVTQQERKTVGVLATDAQLYGSFNMQTMSAGSNWPIIDELEKQYEVVKVDPSQPIVDRYDVLLAVQPSSLGPEGMNHFVDAIKQGQPTAIFEDPCPIFAMEVPATSQPRRPPGGMNPMMMGRQQPPPKGDIAQLWRTLGIDFSREKVIWQDYNPERKLGHLPAEFVFVDTGLPNTQPFNRDELPSRKLQQLLFPFPGSVDGLNASETRFTPLVETGDLTGTVPYAEIMQMTPFGPRGGLNPQRRQVPTKKPYVLAARIQGTLKPDDSMAEENEAPAPETSPEAGDESAEQAAAPKKPAEIDVIVVADIDMLSRDFFRLREQGNNPEAGVNLNLDNVTFVLNTLDTLAGDDRFIAIRSRRPKHRTLVEIEERTEKAREETADMRDKLLTDFEEAQQKEQEQLDKRIAELRNRKNIDPQQLLIEVALAQQEGQQRLDAAIERLEQKRDRQLSKIDTELALEVQAVQDRYKMWAVLLPPIPPLIVAVIFFINRRIREREGISRSRLRS